MSEEPFDIEDAVHQLGVLLVDEQTGLIIETMKQDFYEKYKKFDMLTAWECFVDEINRVEKVIQLHDWLAEHITEIKKIESDENER